MDVHTDLESERPPTAQPAFRRVERDLRRQILGQAFPPDTALPTEAEIASKYSVSRQTVRRAFQDLVAEGLVHRVRGRGTFATPPTGRYLRQIGSVEDLMALSADSKLRIIAPLRDLVDPVAASRLRLPDDRVAVTSFVRMHGGVPFCHTRVCLPPWVRESLGHVKELAAAGTVSNVTVIGLLDHVLTQPIQEADQTLSIGYAPSDVAETLGVQMQAPVLRIDRTYFDTSGEPVELAVSHFNPDQYTYRVRLRRTVG